MLCSLLIDFQSASIRFLLVRAVNPCKYQGKYQGKYQFMCGFFFAPT